MNPHRYRVSPGGVAVEFACPIGDGFALDEGAVLLHVADALLAVPSTIGTHLVTRVVGLASWEEVCRGHRPGRVFSRSGQFPPTDFLLTVLEQ